MSEICFIEARPRVVATGAEATIRLAGGGADARYYRGGQHYRAGVIAPPRFAALFGFDDNGWTGGTVPTSGELGFMPGDPNLIVELSVYYWRDAAITVDAGEETAALPRRLTGTIADVANNDGQLVFAIADPSKLIDKPVLGTGFAGSGGIEGPVEATGRAKRRSWGRVFNVEGLLLDKVNNIYEFGDPACPIKSFLQVRDMGRAGFVVEIAWQGSVAATFAALAAATAPEGGCVAAPSIACVKWWTVPAGPLTADIEGEVAGGYAENAVAIAARMLATSGGPAIAAQAAAEALRPATCGVHIASADDTLAQALDRLFLGVSLFWVLQPDGTIRIGEWAWKASVATFDAQFIARERQLPPVRTRKLGYRRNHRVHQASEVSVAATGDLAFQPTDNSPAPPLVLPIGAVWFGADGHPYRYAGRTWSGADGSPWIGADGGPWHGGGYVDIQDQAGPDAIDLAELANGKATQAVDDAADAQARIAAIVADNKLDKSEKPDLVLRYAAILSEQAGIQNNAAYYAIVAEKTAYDTSVAALTAYLVSLVPAYNDYSADTAIDRVAFNAAFNAFYDARQALLDKIAVEAGRSTATMTLAPTQTILCDYLGAPKTGQLVDRVLLNSRKRGNAVVDAATTWTATFPGSVTGTIDTTSATTDRGDITITGFNGAAGAAEISITSTYDGITLTGKIAIVPALDAPPPPPPASGSAQTSAQSSESQSNSTSAYLSSGVVIGPVRAGASGQIKLEAVISFNRSANGENDAYAKWGYSTSATGPFTDVPAGEVHSTINAFRLRTYDPDDVTYETGAISINQTLSGLTSGTDYYFEFRPRKGSYSAGVPTANNVFTGLKKATQL